MNTVAVESISAEAKAANFDPFGHLRRLRRLVVPAAERPFAIVESVSFMAVVLGLSWGLHRTDPLLLDARFPWLWFAPLVIALRYGTLIGALGGAMMLGVWCYAYPADATWPLMYFAGGLIQTVVAGHFGDTWGARTARARSINDYLKDRLLALSDSHYLMHLSHERLEKDLLSKPTTLRDSITELRRLTLLHTATPAAPAGSARVEPLPGAQHLLEFLAQACQIEVAALYPAVHGKPAAEPVASVGEAFDFDVDDPLVAHALATQSVAHLRSDDLQHVETRYTVCAPLLSPDGGLRALLVVEHMPFLSLNHDNLALLLVLLGYYMDGVEHAHYVWDILDAIPGCPYEFALELGRLANLQRRSGIVSSIVALSLPRDPAHDAQFEHLKKCRASLDIVWPLQTHTASLLINLLPVTGGSGVDAHLARLEAGLQSAFDTNFERGRVGVHTLPVHDWIPGQRLADLVERVTSHA